MSRESLPWILLAVLAVGWVATLLVGREEPAPAVSADAHYSPADIARMQKQIDALQAELEARNAARRPRAERPAHPLQAAAYAKAKAWMDAMRSVKDPAAAATAERASKSAIQSKDPAELLAGLITVRWVEPPEAERAALRRQLEAHFDHRDPLIARAALEAATVIKPKPGDVERWLVVARGALPRGEAETVAQLLVKAAEGQVTGAVAEAILHLLRDRTSIKKAFVMRGIQRFKVLDPRVESRLLDIVQSVDPQDYDSAYFFHFLAARIDPKSDRLVDLILDRAADGKGDIASLMRMLRRGISERQRMRAAEQVLGYAMTAMNPSARLGLLRGMSVLADASHIEDLEKLAARDGLDAAAVALIHEIVRSLKRR